MLREVYVLGAVRTPLATKGGALTEVLPSRLMAALLRESVERKGGSRASETNTDTNTDTITDSETDDLLALILAGEGNAEVLRHALHSSGRHAKASSLIQRGQIGSIEAIRQGALQVAWDAHGDQSVCVAAGGFEVYAHRRITHAGDMLAAVAQPVLPPRTAADLLAARYNLTLSDLNAWSARARQASESTRTPLPEGKPVRDINQLMILSEDILPHESPALEHQTEIPSDAWKVARRFSPELREIPMLHSAAHCAPRVDGAAVVFLGGARAARHAERCARLAGIASVDAGPTVGLAAAHQAIRKVLKQADWSVAQLDVLEIHDCFAAQALAAASELSVPLAQINPLGGSLVRGDAGAAAGALVAGRLFHQLNGNSRRGVAVVSDASGHAVALAMEGFR